MKNIIKIGLLLLLFSQLKAQSIPTNPAVRVSYDVEITSYRQIPGNADLNQLTDFEKLSFKKRKDLRHYEEYLTRENDQVSVITYGSREGYEGTTPDPVVRTVIDKSGVYGYDKSNRLVVNQPISVKGATMLSEEKNNVSKETFSKVPEFSAFTPETLNTLTKQGFKVASSKEEITVQNAQMQFKYNAQYNATEIRLFNAKGEVTSISQRFHVKNASNQLIPAFNVEKTYETSKRGILIENVVIEKITNYTRTEN